AIYFGTGHVPMLVFILVNITFGIAWGVFRPTFSGMMPALLTDEELQKGNAAVQFVANSAMISGTAVGGILVSTIGSSLALGIDAVTFIICGLIVFGLRHLSQASTKKSTILDDLVHGWKVFLSFPWIVAIVAAFSLIVMCWAAAENVLGPLIALQKFDGAKTWAIILTVETFGFVAGSLVGMKIKPKYPMRFLMIVTFSISIYIWTLAAPQPVWVIAGAAFLWGLSLDLWGAIWTTALQREVPREALSRVSAFDGLGSMIFSPVGLAIAAPMAEWIGITRTLEIFSVLSAVVIAATLCVPQVWKMQLTADS
ncbi:MAG: hypothetical protein RL414_42, partial [Actinomycetota bacterium]